MEEHKRIEQFLSVPSDGYGSGDGYGYGYGYGYVDGSGYGDGYGSGYGYGYGAGSGSGDASGSGSGSGIKEYNGHSVHFIDCVQTIITAVRGNIAKGYIINEDMTLSECYVAKRNNVFAHGKTLREAVKELESKLFELMDTEEKLEKFIKLFQKDKKYPAKDFYEWHHHLTGSCEMGRQNFAKSHGIDVDNDVMTVKDFITLTEKSYGGEIIQKLKERYR